MINAYKRRCRRVGQKDVCRTDFVQQFAFAPEDLVHACVHVVALSFDDGAVTVNVPP